jgi:hypothetical protein
VVTAAALFFGNGSQVGGILLFVVILLESSLGSLLRLTQVYTFLFGMVRLVDFTTIALHMG